jgi:hypothetical protein
LVFQKALNTFIDGFTYTDIKSLVFEERIKHCIYTQFEMLQAHPEIVFFLINEFASNPKKCKDVKERFKIISLGISQIFLYEMQVDTNNVQSIYLNDLMMTVFSLNAGLFLLYSISIKLSVFSVDALQRMIGKRKEEKYKIILE